jgi:hypothetical protein
LGDRVAAITAIGHRAEGSAAEAAAFEYIMRSLRAMGLSPVSSGFSDVREGYSTSRIVEARVRGAREDELAIMVPVSSWVESPLSAEGAYGIALALDEAARLAVEKREGVPCPITVRFVFLGAENRGKKADGEAASLGSGTWIARQEGKTRIAVLYLSMAEAPSRLSVRSAGNGVLSPYWYYDGVRRALDASGIGYSLEDNRLQVYRLGLASDFGAAAPYLVAGIPAIELRADRLDRADRAADVGGQAPGDSATHDLSSDGHLSRWFGAFVEHFAGGASGGFADTWDRHYFIFQIGKLSAVLREKNYVAFLVVIFAVAASSFLVVTVARRKAAKHRLRRVPTIAAKTFSLFIVLAVVFLAGKGIARLDAVVLGSPTAWMLSPRVFAAARVLFSFLLFLSLLSFLIEKRMLSSNPFFYEFAALVCLAIDSLVFSAADLSASFYFMWALVLVEISLASRKRWVTVAAYVLMYAPLLVIAVELAVRPDLPSYGKLIAPGYFDVVALTALALPFFVFTASPLLFFARSGAVARKKAVVLFAASALLVEAFALAYVGVSSPVSGSRRRDLSISEMIDQDKGTFEIELTGLRRLGKGSIERGNHRLEYDSPADRAFLSGEDRKPRVGISEKSAPFLDRIDESVAIRFDSPPYGVDIVLESTNAMLVYDCNLPYKVAVDGKSAVVYAGVNPGKELILSLTVASSFRCRLVVTARYLASLETCTQSSGSPLADSGLTVKAGFPIGSGER